MILWNLVPEKWREEAFIAGGYAACPALASDLDLWIFVDCGKWNTTLPVAREEVLAHLRDERLYITEENEESVTEYEGINVNILKVCHVRYGIKIHIMVVDAPVNAVLEGFDVSTHQIALKPSGEVFMGASWTPVTQEPLRLIDTPHTAVRMEKIRARYPQGVHAEVK